MNQRIYIVLMFFAVSLPAAAKVTWDCPQYLWTLTSTSLGKFQTRGSWDALLRSEIRRGTLRFHMTTDREQVMGPARNYREAIENALEGSGYVLDHLEAQRLGDNETSPWVVEFSVAVPRPHVNRGRFEP